MKKIFVQKSVGLDAEALKNKLKTEGKRSFWLRKPGTYTFTISEIEDRGQAGDPNWRSFKFVLETTDGEKINHFILVPKSEKNSFEYRNVKVPDAKPTLFPFINYLDFLKGVGIDVTDLSIIMSVTDAVFSDAEAHLLNAKIKARVDYRGVNIRFIGKDEDGSNLYQAHLNTKPYEAEGEVLEPCKSIDACKNQLISLGVPEKKISGFPDIQEIFEGEPLFEITEEEETNTAIPF